MKKKIGIINIGYGNIASVFNAIKFLGYDACLEKNPKNIFKYSHIILPGVGSFAQNSKLINKYGWNESLKEYAKSGLYLFGICVGMQLMFEDGSEGGEVNKGIGFFKGHCDKFITNNDLNLPHVGFNNVKHKNTKIWNDIPNDSPFYFVHSYRICSTSKVNIISETTYGEKFISFIENQNIFASQFHPEKSHNSGLKLLKNFLSLN